MIKEAYVSFETAKLLKGKGFNPLECGMYYSITTGKRTTELLTSLIACPTQQMAMRWLREVHNIYMDIAPTYSANESIHFIWQTYDSDYLVTGDCDIFYPTYEDAVEAVIQYSLKNLI